MTKKKWFLFAVMLLVLMIIASFVLWRNHEDQQKTEAFILYPNSGSVRFAAVMFEYAEEGGYKLITSEMGKFSSFDSLRIVPTDNDFQGDWIYRLTFAPKSYTDNGEEYIILFGSENLSVDGKTYVPEEGVNYAEILEWIAGKYKYFEDYELLHD